MGEKIAACIQRISVEIVRKRVGHSIPIYMYERKIPEEVLHWIKTNKK